MPTPSALELPADVWEPEHQGAVSGQIEESSEDMPQQTMWHLTHFREGYGIWIFLNELLLF